MRGCRDGDQGARLDGPRLRAARLLLPRDRPQPDRRGGVRETGGRLRGRRLGRSGGSTRDAVGTRLGARGRGGRRRAGPRRGRRLLPARHQGPPRDEGAGPEGLHDSLRRPRGPRGGDRHHGGRARIRPARRDRGGSRGCGGRAAGGDVCGVARPDDLGTRGVGRPRRHRPLPLSRPLDAGKVGPVLRHHEPPGGDARAGSAVRRRRGRGLVELVEHAGARQGRFGLVLQGDEGQLAR